MRKFRCTVTRTDEFIIELDDNVLDEEWRKLFARHFYSFETLEEHAEHLAQFQARMGSEYVFIEGYGYVRRDGELPFGSEDFDCEGNWLPEDQRRQPAEGINIVIVSEDSDIEIDTEELSETKR